MTEASWLASEDPATMLAVLTGTFVREYVGPRGLGSTSGRLATASPRKLRLFACACAMLLPRRTLGLRRSVEAALAFADGQIGAYEMEAERWDIVPGGWTVCNPDAGEAAYYVVRDDSLTGRRAEMAALLRDVFADPFRPVEPEECYLDGHYCRTHGLGLAFVSPGLYRCPDGRAAFRARLATPTVLRLARGVYADRDFAALPVLADALEDAGCDEDGPLLWHLRGQDPCPCLGVPCCAFAGDPDPRWREAHTCVLCRGTGRVPAAGPHVRGCWALDLVLGKS